MYIVQNLKSRGFTSNKEVSDIISKSKTVKGITSMYSKGGSTYAKGGEVVNVDLFEYYEQMPPKLASIVEGYQERYEEGDMDYEDMGPF